jgi:hypothetical protein
MTLAAAKVVVAEQMKIQCSLSSQLALQFREEIQQIQNEFTEKIYWKVSQPKVYLHPIDARMSLRQRLFLCLTSLSLLSFMLCMPYSGGRSGRSFFNSASNSACSNEYNQAVLFVWIQM